MPSLFIDQALSFIQIGFTFTINSAVAIRNVPAVFVKRNLALWLFNFLGNIFLSLYCCAACMVISIDVKLVNILPLVSADYAVKMHIPICISYDMLFMSSFTYETAFYNHYKVT